MESASARDAAGPRPVSTADRRGSWIALCLFAGALALYLPVRGHGFIAYDDGLYVAENPHVASGWSARGVRWAFTSASYADNWHPLTWLSHMLDVELFGLDPGPHHLVNACLHALNAVLLFVALRALTREVWPSALVAALFAVHPLRVESVAWIAERKDLLAGTFWMLALLAYARYARAPSPARYSRVALAFALGLMAKPATVTLPFVLLLLDVWPLGRLQTRIPSLAPTHPGTAPGETRGPGSGFRILLEKLPLVALAVGASALTLVAQRAGGAISSALPFGERCANALESYWVYLRQAVYPGGLAVFYPHPAIVEPGRSRLIAGLAAGLALAIATALAWRARSRAPWVLVGWLWFLGTLVPMIGLVQVGMQAHADRYTYLPSIGVGIALVWGAAAWVRARPRLLSFAALGAVVVVLVLAFASRRALASWRDSITLFEHALAATEANWVAHNNLGLALGGEGRVDEALPHFEEAARIFPGFFEAHLNAGKAHYRIAQDAEPGPARAELELAREAYERAVSLRPAHAEARFDLGVVLANLGALEQAGAELDRALTLDPGYADDPTYRLAREALDRRRQPR